MTDLDYMKLVLQIAEQTRGQTSPNPMVGSIVVKNGEIVGIGAHLKRGEGHAEVQALTMAGDKAEGATIYVTLEPCSHYGKTPPCAELIIEKKIRRVVIAVLDPNPKVSGKGVEKLQAAGIEVTVGVAEEEALKLNKVFFHYIVTKKPFVTLKAAMTLDGKTATKTGESKWITSEAAREDVHRYRHTHDAILVGIGTVLADNPSLTIRLKNGGKNPVRIVLDRTLRIPLDSQLITDKKAPTWIFTSVNAPHEKVTQLLQKGVEVIQVENRLESVLEELGKREITSLYVEGGATIHGSFIKEKLVQQVISYVAPKMFAGKNAPTFSGGEGISMISEALELEIESFEKMGEDLKIVANVKEE